MLRNRPKAVGALAFVVASTGAWGGGWSWGVAGAAIQPIEFTFSGPIHFRSPVVAFPWDLTVLGQRLEIKAVVYYDVPDEDPSPQVGQYRVGPTSVRNVGNDVGLAGTEGTLSVRNDYAEPPTSVFLDDAYEFFLPMPLGQFAQVFIIKTLVGAPPSYITNTAAPMSISLDGVDGADIAVAGNQFSIAARIDRIEARVVPTPGAWGLIGLGGALMARRRRRELGGEPPR